MKVAVKKKTHWKFTAFHEMSTVELNLTIQKPTQVYARDPNFVLF